MAAKISKWPPKIRMTGISETAHLRVKRTEILPHHPK